MKRIKIKDLKDLPDQMEINLDDGYAITIGRVRRGAPMKGSFPLLMDPGGDAPVQPEECGKSASVMMANKWLCERHANIVLAGD
jgi:hypothetical protein